MRDGFIFYEPFRSALKGLPAETQVLLYNAIAVDALYGIEPAFGSEKIAGGFFTLILPLIDDSNRSMRMQLDVSSDSIPI